MTDATYSSVLDSGDREIWARSLVEGKKRRDLTAPAIADLAQMVTAISVEDTIAGSSTMTLSLFDDRWDLVDTGFFDVDRDGKLDAIEVNYPNGSDFWWRVTQVSLAATGSGVVIEMTFMERAAVYLQELRGPVKVARSKKTRAEFLMQLTDKVKKGGGLKFYSQELLVRQAIGASTDKDSKSGGISKSAKNLTVKGGKASSSQIGVANKVLDACSKAGATERAALCLVAAIIVECELKNVQGEGNDAVSFGVIQAIPGTSGKLGGGSFTKAEALDVEFSARSALKYSCTGFENGASGGGGIIGVAKRHSDWTIGRVAANVINGSINNTQGASDYVSKVNKYKSEAQKFIDAYGGMSGGGGGGKAYNFEVGSKDNRNENFWDAMQRLAEEVNWSLFIDGRKVYFDDQYTLIRQTPALILSRGDENLLSVSGTWDARNIATELTVDLVCDPFEFRAGDVFQLVNFGPLSTGSSAKLPGRWLVSGVSRDLFTLSSSFTLVQPSKPNAEPASADSAAADGSGDTGSGSLRNVKVGSAWGGSQSVMDQFVTPFMRTKGLSAGSSKRTPQQNSAVGGASGSDHLTTNTSSYAVDYATGSGAAAAIALARAMGQKSWQPGTYNRFDITAGGKKFSVQILWAVQGHFDHIHVGVRRA